jgi:hypothetical protein
MNSEQRIIKIEKINKNIIHPEKVIKGLKVTLFEKFKNTRRKIRKIKEIKINYDDYKKFKELKKLNKTNIVLVFHDFKPKKLYKFKFILKKKSELFNNGPCKLALKSKFLKKFVFSVNTHYREKEDNLDVIF